MWLAAGAVVLLAGLLWAMMLSTGYPGPPPTKASESGNWFIGYRLEGRTKKDMRTRERLAEKAQSLGLLKYAEKDSPKYDTYGEGTGYVWLLVR